MPITNNENDPLTKSKVNFQLFLEDSIQRQLKKEVNEIFEKKKKEMIEEMEMKKNQIITGVILGITRRMSVTEMRNILTVEIRKEENTKS